MATNVVKVRASEIPSHYTMDVTVKITGLRWLRVRMLLGGALIRLAAWAMRIEQMTLKFDGGD